MPRDIINADALQGSIEEALKGLPTTLQVYKTTLQDCLRRAAETHKSVRKAHRRKSDPGWAQKRFDEGYPLYRFRKQDRNELIELIRDQFDELGQVVELAKDRSVNSARNAAAFLRGLPHHRSDLRSLGREASRLIRRAQTAALRARRHDVLRPPADVAAGPLVGARCVSIDHMIRLGREAQNCLADNEEYWRRLAEGERDFWSLRDGDRLVAVLEVRQARGEVVEALGPSNVAVGLRDARNVARFCEAANLRIGRSCEGLLPDYARPLLVGPTVVEIEGSVALYAEWPTAVRIDLSQEGVHRLIGSPAKTLALSFDPDRSCAETILEGHDPRRAVEEFGRKRLRRILRSIALAQATPTLVQHRLLALAA